MVDLQTQYLKIKDEIDNAMQGVVDAARFINGPDVAMFQLSLPLIRMPPMRLLVLAVRMPCSWH